MFAAADSLITLLVFAAIAIVSSWLQKRKKRNESDPWEDGTGPPPALPTRRGTTAPPPVKRATPPPPKPTSWEDELRRLLEGEEPVPPPAKRPPPVPQTQPTPSPPPVPRRPVRTAAPPGELDKGLAVELPTLAESTRSYQRAKQLDRSVGQFMQQRAGLSASASAYQQASRLDRKVAERMRLVTDETPKLPVTGCARRISSEAADVRSLLHDRRSARSAILAAVILGPPRSLET